MDEQREGVSQQASGVSESDVAVERHPSPTSGPGVNSGWDPQTAEAIVYDLPELKRQLETLLFVAKSPLRLEQLKRLLKSEKKVLRGLLDELQAEYAQRGIQIIGIAEGYQMATRVEYADLVQALVLVPQKVSLSAAALEVLAIVAYRQPITKMQVEYIRGTNSDSIVNSLAEKGLVEEKGEAEVVGRPMQYGSSDLFLKEFGLANLEDLPPTPYALSVLEREQVAQDLKVNVPAKSKGEVEVEGEVIREGAFST